MMVHMMVIFMHDSCHDIVLLMMIRISFPKTNKVTSTCQTITTQQRISTIQTIIVSSELPTLSQSESSSSPSSSFPKIDSFTSTCQTINYLGLIRHEHKHTFLNSIFLINNLYFNFTALLHCFLSYII